jgi:1,4-alpha-glucan branching enzyme
VRAFLAYMYGHPGKKLLFMGSEIGQYEEWNEKASIRWDLLSFDYHRNCRTLSRTQPTRWISTGQGFEWLDFHDVENSIISFIRRARRARTSWWSLQFHPRAAPGLSRSACRRRDSTRILNSDWELFGGSNMGNGS